MRKDAFKFLGIIVLIAFIIAGCAREQVVKKEEVTPPPAAKPEVAPPPAPEKPAPQVEAKPVEEKVAKVEEAKPVKLEPIYFDFDKYNIRDDMRKIIDANAQILKQNPNLKIRIEGNCDERGTNEYNMTLGEKRARSAKDYLVTMGVSADRIEIISYGEEKPVCTEHNEECWWKNRRADFVIIGK
ncbi:MAG: peptidoglycan-associated lipoprotein Pal [Candidatus Aenigmatarchaeota archaeon]